LYEAVRGFSDHDLAGLQTLLAALSFGQGNCERLDTSDSLFNRVARDLSVNMKNHWRPDAAFFGKRNREQLVGIAKECGYADGNGSLGGYKKAELTSSLVRHFVNAHSTAEPTDAQRKAREWLPEAMLFPAVDPGAPAEVEDEADPVDEMTDED
jgi:ParB family chromosome partitioning protein